MAWRQVGTTQTGSRDLTGTEVTVYIGTPDASAAQLCTVMITLGTVAKPLSGAGGNYTFTIALGTADYFDEDTSTRNLKPVGIIVVPVHVFVPPNTQVIIAVNGPNPSETDVGFSSALYVEDVPTAAAVAAISSLDAAGLRAALGMAAADLDTQLDAIAANAVSITTSTTIVESE